ncbi:MAG: hypothetical protein K2L87_04510 [Clostridiales bacterium]|nr:hypothetical protein [Clostridiales bacterium]
MELKQNDLNYFTSHGFEFVSFPNDRGVYYLYILTTDFDGRTTIAIDDMTCQLCVNNKVVLSDYPFPLFMLETVDGEPVYQTTAYKLSFDQEYKCDGAELLDLIKTLGIWGVEEQSDGFILTYKGQSVRVIEGDGTVTLQEVHPIRPSVLTYDSRWGEEKILQEIEAGGAKVITVGGEKFVSVPQKYGYNNVYRLEITPQSKGDYNYCVTLDPMYTTLLKGSTAMCELPFPYMLLRENGEPCGVLLVFGKAYACDIDLLALIRDMGAWRIEEADGTFEMRLGSTRIQVVQKNGTVTLQQVA